MRQRIAATIMMAAVAVTGLAGCSQDDKKEPEAGPKRTVIVPGRPGEPNQTKVAGPTKTAPPTAAEIKFVQMMIPHHQQAIEMSTLAPGQASDSQVKSLARRIDAGQAVEISAMQSWLKQNVKTPTTGHGGHGGPSASPSAHTGMAGMATPQQMTQLKAARGGDFDKLYLNLMITHHQGALTMVKDVVDKGTDVTVQQMARDVQSTQQAEINRMRALLKK
ncbi:DUF305 domain-containing protein [Spirillospora sp. CA-294931]|uniref:DUF305 domain-containing protein n=1 Tax=Spirillospora sp. CA-294931 TaxID=3240042 RepID=UPI003D8CF0ED